MKANRQVLNGFLLALASTAIIVGGFSLALAEGNFKAPLPIPVATNTLFTWPLITPLAPAIPTITVQAISNSNLSPSPTTCMTPNGWIAITVQYGDTLETLALKYGSTPEVLAAGNCLLIGELIPGVLLYVPNLPTVTPSPCRPPPDWIIYTIQPGDTLYHLAQLLGLEVSDLQIANCMGDSTLIRAGKPLYVPTLPPYNSPTPSGTITPSATPSSTPVTPDTPTPTTTLPPTASPTPSSSSSTNFTILASMPIPCM